MTLPLYREISAIACFPKQPLRTPDKQVKTFLFRQGIQTLDSAKCAYTNTLYHNDYTIHRVFEVNDYIYTLSLWSMTTFMYTMSLWSMTTPAPCLCGQLLHLHRVFVVNDYTCTMSLWSMTTFTPCLCGQ